MFSKKNELNSLLKLSENSQSQIDWGGESVRSIIEALPERIKRDLYRAPKISLLYNYLCHASQTRLSEHDFEIFRGKCFKSYERHTLFQFNFSKNKLTSAQLDTILRSAALTRYGNESDDLLSHVFKSSSDKNTSLYELYTDAQIEYIINAVPIDYLNELKMNCIDNYLEELSDNIRLKPHHEQALFDRVVWSERKIYSALIRCIVRERDSATTLFFHLDRAGASKTIKQMNSSESYRFFKKFFRLMMRYVNNGDAVTFLIEQEKIDIAQLKKLIKFNQTFSHFTYSNGKEVMVNNLIEILDNKKSLDLSTPASSKGTTSKHKI